MKVQPDDWRLQGQEEHLTGVNLYFKEYSARKKFTNWDHDHCEFCGEKISDITIDSVTKGYTTENDYYWICENCFEDFKEMFQWNVVNPL